jgi:hypothetical protein
VTEHNYYQLSAVFSLIVKYLSNLPVLAAYSPLSSPVAAVGLVSEAVVAFVIVVVVVFIGEGGRLSSVVVGGSGGNGRGEAAGAMIARNYVEYTSLTVVHNKLHFIIHIEINELKIIKINVRAF